MYGKRRFGVYHDTKNGCKIRRRASGVVEKYTLNDDIFSNEEDGDALNSLLQTKSRSLSVNSSHVYANGLENGPDDSHEVEYFFKREKPTANMDPNRPTKKKKSKHLSDISNLKKRIMKNEKDVMEKINLKNRAPEPTADINDDDLKQAQPERVRFAEFLYEKVLEDPANTKYLMETDEDGGGDSTSMDISDLKTTITIPVTPTVEKITFKVKRKRGHPITAMVRDSGVEVGVLSRKYGQMLAECSSDSDELNLLR